MTAPGLRTDLANTSASVETADSSTMLSDRSKFGYFDVDDAKLKHDVEITLRKHFPYAFFINLPFGWIKLGTRIVGDMPAYTIFNSLRSVRSVAGILTEGVYFYPETMLVRTDRPIPMDVELYYFEIMIGSIHQTAQQSSTVCIGIGSGQMREVVMPGSDSHSYGYYGEDGCFYHGATTGNRFDEPFARDDVVGCGINRVTKQIFFTKNGRLLGFPGEVNQDGPLFPMVSFKCSHYIVDTNFGERNFVFDFTTMVQTMKEEFSRKVEQIEVRDSNCLSFNSLVLSWLADNGFKKTHEILSNSLGITLPPHLSGSEFLNSQKTLLLKECRESILGGRSREATEAVERAYPNFFSENPDTFIIMKCQEYIDILLEVNKININVDFSKISKADECDVVGVRNIVQNTFEDWSTPCEDSYKKSRRFFRMIARSMFSNSTDTESRSGEERMDGIEESAESQSMHPTMESNGASHNSSCRKSTTTIAEEFDEAEENRATETSTNGARVPDRKFFESCLPLIELGRLIRKKMLQLERLNEPLSAFVDNVLSTVGIKLLSSCAYNFLSFKHRQLVYSRLSEDLRSVCSPQWKPVLEMLFEDVESFNEFFINENPSVINSYDYLFSKSPFLQ